MPLRCLAVLSCLCSLLASSNAAIISVAGNASDAEVNQDGSVTQQTSAAARVGASSSLGGGRNAIWVFQLPALVNETLTGATINFGLVTKTGSPTFNADIYGLAFGATSIPPGDFYEGALDTTLATLIQDDAVVPANTAGQALSLNSTGQTALLTYLNNQYLAGAAGNYIYIRLSPDVDAGTTTIGYNVSTANSADTTLRPVLQLTTQAIPEPGTYALAITAASLMGIFLRRRS